MPDNLINIKFGMLFVKGDSGYRTANGSILWECMCDCGGVARTRGADLRNGHTRSCGCLVGGKILHGCAKRDNETKEYIIWEAMI